MKTFRFPFPFVVCALGLLLAGPGRVEADTRPTEGVVNYETPHVHPLDLTPDKQTLLAVNTAAHRLEIFDVSGGTPVAKASVRVGLEPVSVRARSNSEVWVVNHLSDSVSVVSLERLTVTATLPTDNEPADVVFAGNPRRAYVSCAEANALNVFDPGDLTAAPVKVALHGEEPRALAVSPDGLTVYAAFFESGNGTTVLNGRTTDGQNVVSRPEGPYAGQNPPPNVGKSFNPPIAAAVGTPPRVSLIVRQDAQDRWMDDNNGDWSVFVSGSLASLSGRREGWKLADHDVAVIDTATRAVTYRSRLMNIVMALGVNPATGQVTAVGTDALNHIRYEPVLNGTFLRVLAATIAPDGAAAVTDLNPHLNYTQPTVAADARARSLGDPRGVAWRAAGGSAFITGMGSNNVVEVAPDGRRLAEVVVGEGPTGVVLDDAAGRGYVMNKFAGSISVLDLETKRELTRVAFEDPTPAVIKAGRPFLYNTHLGSGLGHLSCASCHVDGKTDRLAWDLGDPRGPNAQVADANNSTGAANGKKVTVSSMKGPMATQTLQDIMAHPTLHWRGDRAGLASFAAAFHTLHGRETAASATDMQKLGAFLNTIHLPPNPYRNLDDSRPSSVTLPDGTTVASATMQSLLGTNSRDNNCLRCHTGGGTRNLASNQELGQAFVAPALTGLYKKLGFWPKSTAGSTSGTGFFHDGSDSVLRVARVNVTEKQPDMLAEIMTLDGPTGPLTGATKRQDTHAGVGRQLTVAGPATAAHTARLDQFVAIANASPHAALIAVTRRAGFERGYYLLQSTQFQSDRAAEQRSLADLLAIAAAGEPVTFTLVAQGAERRLAVDRNLDGVLDGDEPRPPVLASPGAQLSPRGDEVSLALHAVDPNDDPLIFSATGLPTGLTQDAATGRITGTLTAEAGDYEVTATVSDGTLSASVTFPWTVTPVAASGEPGLRGEYFRGEQFGEKVLTRVDPQVSFYWPDGVAPAEGMPHDDFSVRWTGALRPRFTETYIFHADCDDGLRVWLDGVLILDHWAPAPATYFNLHSQPVALTANRAHELKVEFQDFFSDAYLQLRWSSASQAEELLPTSRLSTPDPAADRAIAFAAWGETSRSVECARTGTGATTGLALSFRVPSALAASGLYEVEESPDAKTWTPSPAAPVVADPGGEWARLVVEIPLPTTGEPVPKARFFRLKLKDL